MAQRLPLVKSFAAPRSLFDRLLMPAAYGLSILCAFWPGLRSGFHSDDFVLLSYAGQTPLDLSIFTIDPQWVFHRPLGKALWAVMYRLWGLNAVPYHLVSLGLHWANVLLLVALLRRLNVRSSIALGAGALFALAPLHVETVVWTASLYDLLATAGYLAGLLCILLYWRSGGPAWLALALGAYQLSLWGKELAFTLPLIVVVLAFYQRPRLSWAARAIALCVVLLGFNLAQRYLVWGSIGGYTTASSNYLSFGWDHLAGSIALMVGPLNRTIVQSAIYQVWMLGMAVLIVAGLMAGINQRLLLLAFAWLAITLIPVLNILPPGADLQNTRLLYLPEIGFCIGLAALIDATAQRYAPGWRLALGSALVLLGLLSTIVIWVQIQPWLVAGREADHALQQLHQLVPRFAPGSKLQVAGLPDNYRGAFIFRLGFDHAYGQRYDSLFQLEQVTKLSRPALTAGQVDQIYQVAYAFDKVNTQWKIVQARAITVPTRQPAGVAAQARWDFATCPSNWAVEQGDIACETGSGARLAPRESQAALSSPPIQAPPGWIEVIVDIDVPPGATAKSSDSMFWRSAAADWSKDRSSSLPLLVGSYRYHFFAPPGDAQAPIAQLRLVMDGLSTDLLIRKIVLNSLATSD